MTERRCGYLLRCKAYVCVRPTSVYSLCLDKALCQCVYTNAGVTPTEYSLHTDEYARCVGWCRQSWRWFSLWTYAHIPPVIGSHFGHMLTSLL
eukprot:5097759-Pyramimonas_sp.AAC.1